MKIQYSNKGGYMAKLETIIRKIEAEIKKERRGLPIFFIGLRKRLPEINHKDFDQAIQKMHESGQYFLTRHFHPAQSTDEEKAAMIPDGTGNYFFCINPREDVPRDNSQLSTPQAGNPPAEPSAETINRKPVRGGVRVGAGRPIKKDEGQACSPSGCQNSRLAYGLAEIRRRCRTEDRGGAYRALWVDTIRVNNQSVKKTETLPRASRTVFFCFIAADQ
jgi:hypothetical protein